MPLRGLVWNQPPGTWTERRDSIIVFGQLEKRMRNIYEVGHTVGRAIAVYYVHLST